MDKRYELVVYDGYTGEYLFSKDGFETRQDAEVRAEKIELESDGCAYAKIVVYGVCCGNEMYLQDFTNTCDVCERDYNMSGQLLAPRSQWGEETGEAWYDCVGPFDGDSLDETDF
jgi:hypothetical protein